MGSEEDDGFYIVSDSESKNIKFIGYERYNYDQKRNLLIFVLMNMTFQLRIAERKISTIVKCFPIVQFGGEKRLFVME